MTKRYENGTAHQVTLRMAQYAIRDQLALIEAYTPMFGEPDDEAKEVIAECESFVRDFRRIAARRNP